MTTSRVAWDSLMTTGLFLLPEARIWIARLVSPERSSMSLNRPCSAAALRSVAYLTNEFWGLPLRRSLPCAFAPSVMTMPASSDMEMPTAVSHRHLFGLVFPLAIFESSGSRLSRGQKFRGCPRPKLQGLCQTLNALFWAFFGSLTNRRSSEQVRLKEPSISLTAI